MQFQAEKNGNVPAWSPSNTSASTDSVASGTPHLNQLTGEEEGSTKKNMSPLHSFTSLMDRISPDKTIGDVYHRGVSKIKLFLTNSMEHNPPSEANSRSAVQEVPHF
jgi:hypothetical protein